MCERCDAIRAALSPEEREKWDAQKEEFAKAKTEALVHLVKYINEFKDRHGEIGGPAMVFALALALGGSIGRAPARVREMVTIACMHMIIEAANANDTEGMEMKMGVTSFDMSKAVDPDFKVKSPTMH